MAPELQCTSRNIGGALVGELSGFPHLYDSPFRLPVPPLLPLAHTAHAAVGERLGDGGFFKRREGEGAAGGRLCHGRHRQYTRAASVCAGGPGSLVEVTWEPVRAGRLWD